MKGPPIADPDPQASPPETLWPFPDHRDLYLLVAGVLIGVVLSPAVLGRLAPAGWQSRIFGGEAIQQQIDRIPKQLETLKSQYQQKQQTLADTGVSRAAVQQARRNYQQKRGAYLQRRQQLVDLLTARRDGRAARILVAIVLALALIMVLETLLAPQPDRTGARAAVPRSLGRLKTVRYALLAIAIALMPARPGLLTAWALLFTALLAALALVAGLVPLGRRPRRANE